MIRNLSELIGPTGEDVLIDHFVRKQFLHMAANPSELAELVGLDEIDAILAAGVLRPPRARVVRSGETVADRMYCGETGEINLTALQELLRKGASLVIDNIAPLVPRLARLEQAIERRLLGNTTINAYLTFNKGSAFAAHFDSHDVIIAQVHGAKHWEVFAGTERPSHSLRKMDEARPGPEQVVWEHTLQQGDLLFVPRGTWHRATIGEGGFSLHLTITVVSPSGADYIEWLLERAREDDLIAQDLPRAGAAQDLLDHGQRLRLRIARLLEECDLERFLAALDGQRRTNASSSLADMDGPGDSDVLMPALRRPFALHDRPDMLTRFLSGGEPHRLTPAMADALRAVEAAGHGVAKADLVASLASRWPVEELNRAILRLVRKGLIAVA